MPFPWAAGHLAAGPIVARSQASVRPHEMLFIPITHVGPVWGAAVFDHVAYIAFVPV